MSFTRLNSGAREQERFLFQSKLGDLNQLAAVVIGSRLKETIESRDTGSALDQPND